MVNSKVLTAVAVLVMVKRATVTLSTTGYGDIVPVSDIARFPTSW